MYKAFEEGKTAFAAKNYDEAITKFKSAIEQDSYAAAAEDRRHHLGQPGEDV